MAATTRKNQARSKETQRYSESKADGFDSTQTANALSEPSNGAPFTAATGILFPLTEQKALIIQSNFEGAFRHLSVFMFAALDTLEKTGVSEQEIFEIEPKLLDVVDRLATNYTSEDAFTHGLAIAFEAIRLIFHEHRSNGGRLNSFQLLAMAVCAYGTYSIRLRKERVNDIHLRTDIALQMSVIAARHVNETTAIFTAIGADQFYIAKRNERSKSGGDTVKMRATSWQDAARLEAMNICGTYAAKLKATDVATKIHLDWVANKKHLRTRKNKRTNETTHAPRRSKLSPKPFHRLLKTRKR